MTFEQREKKASKIAASKARMPQTNVVKKLKQQLARSAVQPTRYLLQLSFEEFFHSGDKGAENVNIRAKHGTNLYQLCVGETKSN